MSMDDMTTYLNGFCDRYIDSQPDNAYANQQNVNSLIRQLMANLKDRQKYVREVHHISTEYDGINILVHRHAPRPYKHFDTEYKYLVSHLLIPPISDITQLLLLNSTIELTLWKLV